MQTLVTALLRFAPLFGLMGSQLMSTGVECVRHQRLSLPPSIFLPFLNVRYWRLLSRGSIFPFQGECTQYSKHPLSCFTLRWADRHKSLCWWAERGVKDMVFVLQQWWKAATAKQRKDYISRSTARWAAVYFKSLQRLKLVELCMTRL